MKPSAAIGLILIIVIGILAFSYQGKKYTTRKKVVSIAFPFRLR